MAGAGGFPDSLEHAGNVLRASTSVKLSVRLPPGLDSRGAVAGLQVYMAKNVFNRSVRRITRVFLSGVAVFTHLDLQAALERDAPFGAAVRFLPQDWADGWDCPPHAPWLAHALNDASRAFFHGRDPRFIGEGGSIPFMVRGRA